MTASALAPACLVIGPALVCGVWFWARQRVMLPFLMGFIAGLGGLVAGGVVAVPVLALQTLYSLDAPVLSPGDVFGPAVGIGEFAVASTVIVLTRLRHSGWNGAIAFGIGVASGPTITLGIAQSAVVLAGEPSVTADVVSCWDLVRIGCAVPWHVLAVAWIWKAAQESRLGPLIGSIVILAGGGALVSGPGLSGPAITALWAAVGAACLATLIRADRIQSPGGPPTRAPTVDTIQT